MATFFIDSLDDPRVAPYRDLPERELAKGTDLFIAEGQLLVRRLLESSLETVSVLTAKKRADVVAPRVPEAVPHYIVSDDLIHQIVGFHFHSGIIACGRRPAPPALASFADEPCTLVVCPKIINVANVGSIMRTCGALGASGLILGEESCDPFMRQAIRVSMGAAFALPIHHSRNLLADLEILRTDQAVELVAAVADPDAPPLPQVSRAGRTALLFGPEDHGLDRQTLALCARKVTIPMRDGIDSLNIAVAAAIVIYHFTRAAPPRV